MDITLNLVLRELAPFLSDTFPENTASKTFKHIAFLTGQSQMDASTLYLSACCPFMPEYPEPKGDVYVICPKAVEDGRIEGSPGLHLIWLSENADLLEVSNLLQELKHRLFQWEADLKVAVLSRCSLQELLDISEPFFTNPIFLTTRSLQIAASTKNIPIPHPDLEFAVKHKYFPEEMIHEIVSKKFLQESESHNELSFSYLPNHVGCPLIVKRFEENAIQLNTICLYGLNQPPSLSDFDLLGFLSDVIFQYACEPPETLPPASNQSRTYYFLIDIIEEKITEQDILSSAAFFDIDANAAFQLYILFFRHYIESHAQYMLQLLKAAIPEARIFFYHDKILLLSQIKAGRQDSDQKWLLQQLRQLLHYNDVYCGFSDIFTDIVNLKDAYIKAETAAQLGKKLHPEQNLYSYRDYYTYHLLTCASKEINYKMLYFQQVNRIIEYDKAHGSDNMELLEYYLNCDRNITKVSKHMHLHRNSVLYRINKIEELLGLSLDDPEIRLTLLISFKALHLLAAEQAPES